MKIHTVEHQNPLFIEFIRNIIKLWQTNTKGFWQIERFQCRPIWIGRKHDRQTLLAPHRWYSSTAEL